MKNIIQIIIYVFILLISYYFCYQVGYNRGYERNAPEYIIGKGTMVTYDLSNDVIRIEIAEKADPNTIDILDTYAKAEEIRKTMNEPNKVTWEDVSVLWMNQGQSEINFPLIPIPENEKEFERISKIYLNHVQDFIDLFNKYDSHGQYSCPQ